MDQKFRMQSPIKRHVILKVNDERFERCVELIHTSQVVSTEKKDKTNLISSLNICMLS